MNSIINFQLNTLDEILPAGQAPDLHLSWFWLTDGDLWLTFGDCKVYEYSSEAIAYFGNKATPYNDYYIVRFLEDFTEIFEKLSESVPRKFYDLTENLDAFETEAEKWLDLHDIDENEDNDFYHEQYDQLISWTYQRKLTSGHLIGGPYLSFFRCNDQIRIVWETEHRLENGISLWTAKNGSLEMNYADFVRKVQNFGEKFFAEMKKQIELAIAKDWGEINLDRQRLIEEHKERRREFDTNLSFLTKSHAQQSDWTTVEQLYRNMRQEINE